MSMFSVVYGSDGVGRASIDYSAVSTSGLGDLISGTAARLAAAKTDEFTFVMEVTIGELLSKSRFVLNGKRVANKWDLLAATLVDKGYDLSEVVEVGGAGAIRAVRVLSDEFGLKEVKRAFLEF